MKFILGTKEHMTQIFSEDGRAVPVTKLVTSPLVVTQVKSVETDGYNAVQVGFGEQKESRLSKAQIGHARKAGDKLFRVLREFRVNDTPEQKVGDVIELKDVFAVGDTISVQGASKGKGFQGVVKRYNFGGGPRSHGQKHNERTPGSIGGGGSAAGRVVKGKKMPGRMGSDTVTVKNLTIAHIDGNTLFVKGAVPGHRGTLIAITG